MSYYDELLKKESEKIEIETSSGNKIRVTKNAADKIETARRRLESINREMPKLRDKYIIGRRIKL